MFGSKQHFLAAILVSLNVSLRVDAGLTERGLEEKGLVPSMEEYCNSFSLAKVVTKQTSAATDDAGKRQSQQRQLARARETVSDLAVLCNHFIRSSVTTQEKIRAIDLLTTLNAKIVKNGELGVGNIELYCHGSMLISAIYFNVCPDLEGSERSRICASIQNTTGQISLGAVCQALKDENCEIPALRKDATLYDLALVLAFSTNDVKSLRNGGTPDLQLLAEELGGRMEKGRVANQLDGLDAKWLAWDLVLSIRTRALCRLTAHMRQDWAVGRTSHTVPLQQAVQQFESFRLSLSNELSQVERQAIDAKVPSTDDGRRRDIKLMSEVRDYVSDRGQHFFEMLSYRLGQGQ